MNCNRHSLLSSLRKSLKHHEAWSEKLAAGNGGQFGLHLAILREPYLSFIMEGRKKVETRFAKRPCPPYERVTDGDVVLLKEVGGEVVGVCEVEKVWFYKLNPGSLALIKERFANLICPADGNFWTEREEKTVATLMLLKNVVQIDRFRVEKRDRRGWVTFEDSGERPLFAE
jgi:hypothetical protein